MRLSSTLHGGLCFLTSAQSDAGYWSDWQLPPGESRMWTTAYIAYRLSSLRIGLLAPVDQSLTRAEAWLRASEFREGGWGYARETGPDADSTSLAVLFLRARGSQVADASYRCLCEHARSDGGFSTYTLDRSYGAWVESHPEVSAVALRALLETRWLSIDQIVRGTRYVRANQRADGLWNAYWWTSCLYATEASLSLLRAVRERFDVARVTASLHRVPTSGAFESALHLLCLARLGAGCDDCTVERARALVAEQLSDGSWPTSPILRLTGRHVSEPWASREPGPVFRDEQRLFTTATVVAALDAFDQVQPR